MTLQYQSGLLITGTIVDRLTTTWTNLAAGYKFLETNTFRLYYWDGSDWQLLSSCLNTIKRKSGRFWGSSSNSVDGLFLSNGISVGTASAQNSSTDGPYSRWSTGTTLGNNAGHRINRNTTTRQLLPYFQARLRLQNYVSGKTTLYCGLMQGGTDPTGDDPLNAGNGVILSVRSTDGGGNFQIAFNDATGATNFESTGIPIDTAWHNIKLYLDDAAPRVFYKMDNNAWTILNSGTPSTNIPIQAGSLACQCQIETVDGTDQTIDVYGYELETN
jgi:hypothetical protein